MDDDSNASVLIADDTTLKTLSPNWEINVKKMVLDGGGKGITGSVRDAIFCSIRSTAMKDALESDINQLIMKHIFWDWHIPLKSPVICVGSSTSFNLAFLSMILFFLSMTMLRSQAAISIFMPDGKMKRKLAIQTQGKRTVKANTVVFTSLALLDNLCSSAKLDL
jgi:hypothetical protein